jgi:hypothetical protein
MVKCFSPMQCLWWGNRNSRFKNQRLRFPRLDERTLKGNVTEMLLENWG